MTTKSDKPLEGKVALVAGATRGAGRGIACMLGEAGAIVYCSGRSTRQKLASGKDRKETIEETAEMVDSFGGKGIAVQTDHTDEHQVKVLAEKIRQDHGKLDVLVNDVWGGDVLTQWGVPFWELDLEKGFQMVRTAVHSHIITARHMVPLMLGQKSGLILEITDGDSYTYRGNLFYDWVKTSVIRLAFVMSWELRHKGIVSLALTPGFLRSEAMLDHFGVTDENWQDGAKKDPHFIASETPFFVGRAVAHLAVDPEVEKKNGRVLSSWRLSREYKFTDMDGSRPDWGQYADQAFGKQSYCDENFYNYWFNGMMDKMAPDWP